MIISYLMGGLGNQLFQWALGKSISKVYDQPLYIDKSFYLNQIGITPRQYELYKFENINVQFVNKQEEELKNQFITIHDSISTDIKIDKSHNYFLNGYFQSENYFKQSSDLIRKELCMPNEKKEKFLEEYGNISECVSIHIRRTDYLTSPKGFHPVQPIYYYQQALSLLNGYDKLLIFSDDIEWCKNNLEFNNTIFVSSNSNVDDLWLMSLCRDNIIANSSFSWWGAWLNQNRDKRVIAPKRWFNGQFTPNLIPDDWIRI